VQVFRKFFSKTVRKQTKTRHNTCEACAGLYIAMSGLALSLTWQFGARLFCAFGENWGCART